MEYQEEDMLMLSGIQHYVFCPRQWALIHMEQEWEDNKLTVEGNILHTNVDNPFYRQKNGKTITLRSVSVASKRLGLYGIIDAIELVHSKSKENTFSHASYPGLWRPLIVEYKRGRSKPDARDEVQLAAQVLSLEEMYNINIDNAAFFYGETRHREIINISDALRELTYKYAFEMHKIFKSGDTPQAIKKPHCRNCSLLNKCWPKLANCTSVSYYLKKNLYEKTS